MNNFNVTITRIYWLSLIVFCIGVCAFSQTQTALQFDGTNDYVTFGAATTTLGAQNFTLECWFKWTGGGVTTSTGTGGLTTVIPLITKGRGEADGDNRDMNYFLGIQGSKLAADFEDIDGATIDGDAAGQNQPIIGLTTITTNVWHHAAATFDGTFWRLYLDGVLDNTLDVTNVGYTPPRPQFNSIQHAGLATAMTSTGVAAGYFAGIIDEVRIWNYARTQQQIQDSVNIQITSSVGGLLGRWGLNDGSGTTAVNTISGSPNGTLTNGPVWTSESPFTAPTAPSSLSATAVLPTQINLSWNDNSTNETKFEIEQSTLGSSGPFSLIATLNPNTTSYNNTGLNPLTEYWYRVRAVNPGGNSAYSNVANATTPSAGTPPSAPSGLIVTTSYWHQANLSWNDNSNNETSFIVERSTTGSGGPFSSIVTLDANATSYANTGLNEQIEYCYRVYATNGAGSSAYTDVVCSSTPSESTTPYALDLAGTNAYVTFGTAPSTGVASLTIECWFKRKGTGRTTYTGSGGMTAIPLVTKGRFETDASTVDMNYFFGIHGATNVLAADFEEGTGSTSPGLNHPVYGATPISNDVWYHAAVTYDTTLKRWQLFLNGVLENEEFITPGSRFPQFNSIQHAALGTALNSSGVDSGKFYGTLDEVRIWNYARSVDQILEDINTQITTPRAGLVARWGLNEGTGITIYGKAGTSTNGTIQRTNYTWVEGAPFNLSNPPAVPPAAPTNLLSGGVSNISVQLNWTDNSNNETSFEIERSTTGSGGSFTVIGSMAVNSNSFIDSTVTAETHNYYRVRAINNYGNSNYTNVLHVITLAYQNNAVNFDGNNAYITTGTGITLNTPTFTVETWFKRTATGVSVTTGTGGIPDAIPLITKGTSETEDVTKDINYFLAIKAGTNTLCADFEEGSGGSSPSLNHPVIGVTPISLNKWYHAAVTYDGSTWKLYLNGNLETELFVGQPAGSATTSPVAFATSIRSDGTTIQGYFYGIMDEARIWNYARTQSEILATINTQISTPQSGLIARWGLNEGTGTTVYDSSGSAVNGIITGTGWSWTVGSPFNVNFSPATPVLISPLNGASNVTTTPTLNLSVSDPNQDDLTVKFYGRALPGTLTPTPFTIVVLPDAQNYTDPSGGGSNAIFKAQTQWIVNNKTDRNIVYVNQVGDIVDNGDTYEIEWKRADTTMSILENPAPGIPYGIAIGNHDQIGGTTFYNQYFGVFRFTGRPYYGGNFGSNNNNNYQIFTASGMSFIAINLEYNRSAAALHWADSLLKSDTTRRGILISHDIIGTGNPAAFSSQGQVTYDSLKDNPNLFLMLCGHAPGEGRRTDIYNGDTVYTLMADYQSLANGGNGWLRIMEFSPADNLIKVKTYSPTLDQYNTASSSQFNLTYTMQDTNFHLIDTKNNIMSGSSVSTTWSNLELLTQYQWYATVNDGEITTTGPVWNFTTEDFPVPIQLASLVASLEENSNTILIKWSTISEINNYGFFVQRRSNDETTFSDIQDSFVPGNGTTLESQSYSFKDNTITIPGIYHYRLRQVDNDGLEYFSFSVSINVSVLSVDETVPLEFSLSQNYPNPFNPSTVINYSVPLSAERDLVPTGRDGQLAPLANGGTYTNLKVYNLIGKEVATLVNGYQTAGNYKITFDGSSLSSGLYFYKLQSGSNVEIKKMTLIK
jgi:hypothetical protein